MKVAYVFSTTLAHRILSTMIVPQLEEGRHGADVVGMFFFVDNCYMLTRGNAVAERLKKLLDAGKIKMLIACDQCAYEREIDKNLIAGAGIGCFPDLYGAIGKGGGGDQGVTL